MGGGEFDRDGIADLANLISQVAGELVLRGKGVAGGELGGQEHAREDVQAQSGIAALDEPEAGFCGDAVKREIQRLATPGAVILQHQRLNQSHFAAVCGGNRGQGLLQGMTSGGMPAAVGNVVNERLAEHQVLTGRLNGRERSVYGFGGASEVAAAGPFQHDDEGAGI